MRRLLHAARSAVVPRASGQGWALAGRIEGWGRAGGAG